MNNLPIYSLRNTDLNDLRVQISGAYVASIIDLITKNIETSFSDRHKTTFTRKDDVVILRKELTIDHKEYETIVGVSVFCQIKNIVDTFYDTNKEFCMDLIKTIYSVVYDGKLELDDDDVSQLVCDCRRVRRERDKSQLKEVRRD